MNKNIQIINLEDKKMEQEIYELSCSQKNDIVEAWNSGNLIEEISNTATEVIRDSGGLVKKIYFAVGGPTIWLDMCCQRGYVIASWGSIEAKSGLPLAMMDDIIAELEELYYA